MSYQVLARKWRPRSFHEMVGQEHVLQALINALDNERLHHAYLFTGTRGVGKTTISRIFAKSLNCEQGMGSTPCGTCSACTAIDEGRFVDLIEVDAASRTKVEDTRELLDNVQYAPTQGRYKVYLIDEVHMLSAHSFNALLKTLEEPPPHVKFLLATTDPQKLPVTILSRCLQFNLKRLPLRSISGHLEHILGEEKLSFENDALLELARAADGSMRDALSLMDQAIAYTGGNLSGADVRTMLGTIERGQVYELLRALAAADATRLIRVVAELREHAADCQGVLAELLTVLQQIATAQFVPEGIDENLVDRDAVEALAKSLAREDVQLYYQIALIGRRDLPLAPEPYSGLEMVLLRMLAFKPEESASEAESGTSNATTPARPKPAAKAVETSAATQTATAPAPAPTAPTPHAAVGDKRQDWHAIIDAMQLKGMVRQLADNCVLQAFEGNQVRLLLEPSHAQLRSAALEKRLGEALARHMGGEIRLQIEVAAGGSETPAKRQAREQQERHDQARRSIAEDEHVKALQDTFGAEVREESVRPLE